MSTTNWGWLDEYERELHSEWQKSNASDDFNGNWWNDLTCGYVSRCVVHGYYGRSVLDVYFLVEFNEQLYSMSVWIQLQTWYILTDLSFLWIHLSMNLLNTWIQLNVCCCSMNSMDAMAGQSMNSFIKYWIHWICEFN